MSDGYTISGEAPKFASISHASSGDNAIVAAVAGKRIRVLSYAIVGAGAVSAKFRSGTTDITGAMAFGANGGIAMPFNPVGYFETAAGAALNVNLSGAVAVAGHVTYIEVV
jgi:hypothetical protein